MGSIIDGMVLLSGTRMHGSHERVSVSARRKLLNDDNDQTIG